MEHLGCWVEILEPRDLAQRLQRVAREIEVDLPQRFSCQARQLLISDSLQEGLADVGTHQRPLPADCLTHEQPLRISLRRARVPLEIGSISILESSNRQAGADDAASALVREQLVLPFDHPLAVDHVPGSAPRTTTKASVLVPRLQFCHCRCNYLLFVFFQLCWCEEVSVPLDDRLLVGQVHPAVARTGSRIVPAQFYNHEFMVIGSLRSF